MKEKEKEKLSYSGAMILIYMFQTGVIVFSIPQLEARYFGTNGWLALFLCYAAVNLNILLILAVYRLGKGRNIFEILELSLPKPLLYPLYLFMAAVWSMIALSVGKQYVFILQMMAFPTTNPMVFLLAVQLLSFYVLSKGVYNISKASMVFFILATWIVLLLLFFFGDLEWTRMTPFVFQGAHDMARGFFDMFTAFLGYEICLLLFPHTDSRTKFLKAVFWGNGLLMIQYLLVSVVSFGFFSIGQLRKTSFPMLDLLSYVQFPFVERIESLFYAFFLFSIVITVVVYYWAAAEAGKRIIPAAGTPIMGFVLMFATYLVAFIPGTLSEIQAWLRYAGYMEAGIALGLPLLLIPLAWAQRRRKEQAT